MSPVLCIFALLAASCSAAQISPKQYTIELLLDTANDVFSGNVVIDAKVVTAGATYFVLHNNGLNISTVSVVQQGGANLFLSMTPKADDQTLMITLNRGLTTSLGVQITITYQGNVSTDSTGLFTFKDGNNKFYMTNFYPIYARKVFPCFDVPSEAAQIALSVIVDKENGQFIGNTKQIGKTQLPNGYTQYQLETTTAIAPYSLFFTMGQWSSDAYYVPVPSSKVWLPPSLQNQVQNIDPNLAGALRSSNVSFLVSNYLDHLNIFVAPVYEEETYSGLNTIVLRQDIVLKNARETTAAMEKDHLLKITYSAMRLFYGTVVRPADWGNNWLATSLPWYLAYTVFDEPQFNQTYGDSNDNLVAGLYERVFDSSSGSSSPPVYTETPPSKPSEILSVVRNSGVEKGVYVLKTLESFVNNTAKMSSAALLKNTLYSYLIGMNGTAGDTKAFIDFLGQSINPPIIAGKLSDIMLPILSQGGYPLVKLDRISHSLDMSKDSFVKMNSSPSKYAAQVSKLVDPISWSFPVTVSTSANPTPDNATVYFFSANSNSQSIQGYYGDDGWALLNIDGKGMMRVSYDPVSWILFSKYANSTFSPATRAKLVADAFATSESMVQSWTATLKFLEVLDHETHLAPWKVALDGFARMWSWIYYTGSSGNNNSTGQINLAEPFKAYVRTRLNNAYQRLGPIGSNDDVKDPVRRLVVAAMCQYGDQNCVSNLTAQYNQMLWNGMYPSNDLLSVVVCNGLRNAKIDSWTNAFNTYVYSGVWYPQPLRNSHYSFLACPDPDNNGYSPAIDSFLSNVLTNTAFPRDQIVPAVSEILDNPQHVDQVLQFFVQKQPSFNVSTSKQVEIVSEIGKRLTSTTQTTMLKNFLVGHNVTTELSAAVNQSIAMGNNKNQYILKIQNDVKDGLDGAAPTTPTSSPPTGGTNPTPSNTTITTVQPPSSTTPGAASAAAVSFLALLAALALAFAAQ